MPLYQNVNGSIKEIKTLTQNVNGALKSLNSLKQNVGGVLKEVFSLYSLPTSLTWTGNSTNLSNVSSDGMTLTVYGESVYSEVLNFKAGTKITVTIKVENSVTMGANIGFLYSLDENKNTYAINIIDSSDNATYTAMLMSYGSSTGGYQKTQTITLTEDCQFRLNPRGSHQGSSSGSAYITYTFSFSD